MQFFKDILFSKVSHLSTREVLMGFIIFPKQNPLDLTVQEISAWPTGFRKSFSNPFPSTATRLPIHRSSRHHLPDQTILSNPFYF